MTGLPQCVLVHVDVGTAALGQGPHNASSGKVPMLIFAGEAPTTFSDVAGSRSEHVHWYQDVHSQDKILEPFTRYSRRITAGEDVRMTVARALLMASTGCPGPVYLTATREVLAMEARVMRMSAKRMEYAIGEISDAHVAILGEVLLKAKAPLVITGYLGKNHAAVRALVRLADLVKGLQVLDSEYREMSFPASHPARVTPRTGARAAVQSADVILVLDADVPWIPTKVTPSEEARIFHIDCDPRKEKMQLFDIGAERTWNADCGSALHKICTYLERDGEQVLTSSQYETLAEERLRKHAERLAMLSSLATVRPDNTISVDILFAALRKNLPRNTIYANDVVTNQVALGEQLCLDTPGTFLTKGGSGLGWSLGASIGVKLALSKYNLMERPKLTTQDGDGEMVCCVTGDGSFWFSSAAAPFLDAAGLETPFLTIVVNNGGWQATRACVKDVHPGGVADRATGDPWKAHLKTVRPDYVGVAKNASGNTMWGRQVTFADELEAALGEAKSFVLQEKKGAILEVVVT